MAKTVRSSQDYTIKAGAGFSSSPHFMYSGTDSRGEWYQLYQIGFGGIPARPHDDGPDGHSMWPSFTNVPQEYLEAYFPLRIEKHETVADTGGAGVFRGGNALRVDYCFLEDGEISIHDDRWLTYPWGVNGGDPGQRSIKVMYRGGYDTGVVEYHESKCDNIKVSKGDILAFITWGGGGYGNPIDRDAEKVALEVSRGLVTVKGAKTNYGVICSEAGVVNLDATEELRNEFRESQPSQLPVYNKGPELDTILANCKKETHLKAPKPPVFKPSSDVAVAAE